MQKDVCPAHSGFEVGIKNVADSQTRMEKNMNTWHEHIDLRIDKLEQKMNCFAVIKEKVQTNRTLIYGSMAAMGTIAGYLIYHIGQK